MNNFKKLFLRHVGQTSPSPMSIEIERAEGVYLYTPGGKQYIDLISGVSVSNVGHGNKKVVEAVCAQAKDYMHLMVYGEMIQSTQVLFAKKIVEFLPSGMDSVYFVNSGSEAIEGAMKLAKRYTGRSEIVSFKNCYHGSTQGALSIMGSETFKNSFRPLLPFVRQIEYNNIELLSQITEDTAAVVIEPIQGEGGFRIPTKDFLTALRKRCNKVGALIIYDEIQTGFGRTGTMFAWQREGVAPDIIAMAKAMGGGMPIGGFAASNEVMSSLTHDPVLGHITTFGGHPVCCAAGMAAMQYILDNNLMARVEKLSELFAQKLTNPLIKEIRRAGLLIAVDFKDKDIANRVIGEAVEKGLVTESFLFCETALRIAPPLIITEEQVCYVCDIINSING